MRLCFVSRDARWQAYRFEIFQLLANRYDLKIEILTNGPPEPHLHGDDRVSFHPFASWFPRSWRASFFPGGLWWILRTRPDVVLGLSNVTQLTEYAAFVICKLARIRMVFWTHGFDHDPPKKRFGLMTVAKRKYVNWFLRHSDCVITFSEEGRECLVSQGCAPDRVVTAPNTLNTDRWIELADRVAAEPSSAVRNELGLGPNDELLLFVGRLRPEKRVHDVIRAMPLIIAERPTAKLAIIGSGPDASELSKLAQELAPGHVVFVGPLFDDYQLAVWFTVASVVAIPGTVGLGIVHAFCFGRPFITTQILGHGPELQYLRPGENGFMVRAGDIEDFARVTVEILSDPVAWARASAAARATALEEANVSKMLSAMAHALGVVGT